jgi:ammonia channel protein AmtB
MAMSNTTRPAEEQEEIGLDLSQHGEVMQDTMPASRLPT